MGLYGGNMQSLELWQQITLMICMIILLLACFVRLAYAIINPAGDFMEEVEFKPIVKIEVSHVRNTGSN